MNEVMEFLITDFPVILQDQESILQRRVFLQRGKLLQVLCRIHHRETPNSEEGQGQSKLGSISVKGSPIAGLNGSEGVKFHRLVPLDTGDTQLPISQADGSNQQTGSVYGSIRKGKAHLVHRLLEIDLFDDGEQPGKLMDIIPIVEKDFFPALRILRPQIAEVEFDAFPA